MVVNMRYVFVLSIGMLVPTDLLIGMSAKSPAAPHDIPGAPGGPRAEDVKDPMDILYEAINRAEEKDLELVQKLVSEGFDDDYFYKPELAHIARTSDTPLWHCLALLMKDYGPLVNSNKHYAIRHKMFFVLATVYEKDLRKIRDNVHCVNFFYYMIGQEDPNYELVAQCIERKICDPNCLDAQGNSAIITVDDEAKMQALLDLGVDPKWNRGFHDRPDKVIYFVLEPRYAHAGILANWQIMRKRTDEEVARIKAESARELEVLQQALRKELIQNSTSRCVIS